MDNFENVDTLLSPSSSRMERSVSTQVRPPPRLVLKYPITERHSRQFRPEPRPSLELHIALEIEV